jgi:hypothetical protein
MKKVAGEDGGIVRREFRSLYTARREAAIGDPGRAS